MAARGDSISQPIVDTQPRAAASKSVSILTVVIKALRQEGKKEFESCIPCCLYCLVERSPLRASALLIGREPQHYRSGQDNRSNVVLCLKNHLSELNVEIFKCKENYMGTKDDLFETISQFLLQQRVSIFILYYSGPTNATGDWLFTTRVYGKERKDIIWLDTIANKWKERAGVRSSCSQLLIIVDADKSGEWVKKARNYESDSNISIMASSGSDRAVDRQYTRSLIGNQGVEFYPVDTQQKIDIFLASNVFVPYPLCCYVVCY